MIPQGEPQQGRRLLWYRKLVASNACSGLSGRKVLRENSRTHRGKSAARTWKCTINSEI